MDWIRNSWAVGRQWQILGGLGKAPEQLNLVFLFLPTFSLWSSLRKSVEECYTSCQSGGQEGSRAIRFSLPRGTFWALPVASWGDTCSMFTAFPRHELWWRLCYPSSWKSMWADPFLSNEIQIHNWRAFRGIGCEEWCHFPGASKLGSRRWSFYWYLAIQTAAAEHNYPGTRF